LAEVTSRRPENSSVFLAPDVSGRLRPETQPCGGRSPVPAVPDFPPWNDKLTTPCAGRSQLRPSLSCWKATENWRLL